jgi:hypothetical protein
LANFATMAEPDIDISDLTEYEETAVDNKAEAKQPEKKYFLLLFSY